MTATYPAGKVGTTAQNLLAAAEGEKEEWSELYPTFAAKAGALPQLRVRTRGPHPSQGVPGLQAPAIALPALNGGLLIPDPS